MDKQGDINIEDERGNVIDRLNVYIGDVTQFIYDSKIEDELQKTFCLQFIDPYGNTTFNSLQQEVLIDELQSLLTPSLDTEKQQFLRTIIEFISKYKDEVHTYVKFRGD